LFQFYFHRLAHHLDNDIDLSRYGCVYLLALLMNIS
jgi:hypothetical protein